MPPHLAVEENSKILKESTGKGGGNFSGWLKYIPLHRIDAKSPVFGSKNLLTALRFNPPLNFLYANSLLLYYNIYIYIYIYIHTI